MKKLTAALLAMLMLLSLSTAAFAEGEEEEEEEVEVPTTTLTTTVPDASYTLNIPADQEITYGTGETYIDAPTITDGQHFAEGKNVQVTITFDSFTSDESTSTIPFNLFKRTSQTTASNPRVQLSSGDTMIFLGKSDAGVNTYNIIKSASNSGAPGKTYDYDADGLVITISSTDWGKAASGDYSATITFSAEIVNEE